MPMDPALASSLVTLGGGLLEGIFAPSMKKQLATQAAAQKDMASWRARQIATTLKPKTPYYSSGNLPQLGGSAMSAVMGNLAQRLGPEMLAKWGINPAAQAPPQVAPAPLPALPAALMQKPGFAGQDLLMRRYGG